MRTANSMIRVNAYSLGDRLYEDYPRAFIHPNLKGKGMRPLKVGIDKDIKEAYPEVSNKVISAFLGHYTSSAYYRRCGTMVGNYRVDLKGDAVAIITPDHARHSELSLNRMTTANSEVDVGGQCSFSGKVIYAHLEEAAEAGRKVHKRTAQSHLVSRGYKCSHCGGHHWSNEKKLAP